MFNIKKCMVLLGILATILLFTSQTPPANNINGFIADTGSFEILSSYQGRNNVLKIEAAKTQYSITRYSLSQYRGKPIAIEIMSDVRREGAGGLFVWQVNNEPFYPALCRIDNARSNTWYSLKGRILITPTSNDPILYMTNWGDGTGNKSRDIYYIANPRVTITEASNIGPDLSLTPLKEIYKNDFLIGNISGYGDHSYTGRHFDLLKHHFDIVTTTCIYDFYLAPLSKGGAYRWANADNFVDNAVQNNLQLYGHVLIYHAAEQPAWLTEGTREEVFQNMNDYITTVVRHFKGRINTWEVTNEGIKHNITNTEARGDWKKCVINSRNESWCNNRWYDKLGPDYIELAFRAARTADPNITLYYNEYIDNPNKAEVVRKMIQDINDRYKKETGGTRNLIEGVGTQTHLYNLNFNITNERKILQTLSSLGIEIAISEIDVPGRMFDGIQTHGQDTDMSEIDGINQGLAYARLMNLIKEFSPYIKRVSFWGLDDNTSWMAKDNPTMFDWKLNAKPAFYAVSDPDGFIAKNGGGARR